MGKLPGLGQQAQAGWELLDDLLGVSWEKINVEIIEYLRACGPQYIVGTPKAQLQRFEEALLEDKD